MRYDFRKNSIQVKESNPRLCWSLQASALHGVNFVELGMWLAIANQLPSHLQTEVVSQEAKAISHLAPAINSK